MLLAAAAASSEPKIATYAQKIRFSTFDPDMFPALGRPPGAGQWSSENNTLGLLWCEHGQLQARLISQPTTIGWAKPEMQNRIRRKVAKMDGKINQNTGFTMVEPYLESSSGGIGHSKGTEETRFSSA